MFWILLWTAAAQAGDCNPSAAQVSEWAQRAKTGVVWDSPKGLRTSSMDEAEIRAAASSNACLKDALDLAKQRPWLGDPSLRESLRYLYCQRVSSAAVVPHVSYKGTATAFVRINLAAEAGGGEFSEGGKMEAGPCRELFLRQIRENTLAAVERMKARKPAADVGPKQMVKSGLAAAAVVTRAPDTSNGRAVFGVAPRKAGLASGSGQEIPAEEGARSSRGAE